MTPKNPSIILVRPQLPENIGMVARVMHNFGLKDLIIVSPRDNWLNNKSINAAKKATKIIKNIKVYNDLENALSNFSFNEFKIISTIFFQISSSIRRSHNIRKIRKCNF